MSGPFAEKPAPRQPRISGKAIAALVLGLLSFCLSFLAAIPAIIFGVWAIIDISNRRGQLQGQPLAIAGLVMGCFGLLCTPISVALLLPAVQAAREAARRQVSMNNFRVIGLAMHNYHDTYKSFPYPGSNDPQYGIGRSWRVQLLPFVEHAPLFTQFDQHQPWDHPANQALIDPMPDIYRSPNVPGRESKTVYLAVVGPRQYADEQWRGYRATFSGEPPRAKLADIIDGTLNTVLIVEADADQAVTWTKPDDWQFDPANPRRGLGGLRPGGFLTLFADGSVHFISNAADEEACRNLLSRTDGNTVDTRLFAP